MQLKTKSVAASIYKPNLIVVVQAVLIEHDEIVLSDLSAVVVSEGRKGDNIIKDYDQVRRVCIGLLLHVSADHADKKALSLEF